MNGEKRCGTIVTARIATLMPTPGQLSPPSRAALANLRRGVGKSPGSVPQIWQYTLPDIEGGNSVWAQRREVAVHVALTQWAMHQQSKSSPMHRTDRTFGEALRLLAATQNRSQVQDTAAYRRMMALASCRGISGITTHARGLIAQLRAAGIGFDYGRWADDLFWLQVPGRTTEVQRRWGRDFHRLNDQRIDEALETIASTTPHTSEGAV